LVGIVVSAVTGSQIRGGVAQYKAQQTVPAELIRHPIKQNSSLYPRLSSIPTALLEFQTFQSYTMAQAGGCVCGNVRYEVEGEPATKVYRVVISSYFVWLTSNVQALCHCSDCRKTTGSTYSTNGIYPETAFRVTQGTAKVFTKIGGSGNDIESHFW
jgi:hypothetical protein